MRVRALQWCYVNECGHHEGEVFEIDERNFNPEVYEEVGDDVPLSRELPPTRSPSGGPPISGGREKGVETEALEPELDPEDEPRSGKKRR